MNRTNERNASNGRDGQDYTEIESERIMLKKELASSTDPLGIEEERKTFREMVRAAISGDEARRNTLRMKIFKANMRLAYDLAKKIIWTHRKFYGDYANSVIDLTHVAYGALFQAIDKFQVEAGNRFSTYATTAIRNELNSANGIRKRRENKVGPMERLDHPVWRYDGKTWFEVLGDDSSAPIPDEVFYREKTGLLQLAMRNLSRRERDLVYAKFRIGAPGKRRQLQDVATRYGITPQRASQIVKAALDKLQKAIAA